MLSLTMFSNIYLIEKIMIIKKMSKRSLTTDILTRDCLGLFISTELKEASCSRLWLDSLKILRSRCEQGASLLQQLKFNS